MIAEDKIKNFHPFQYIPFGGGRRLCIGNLFAITQAKTLLCMILRCLGAQWDGTQPLAVPGCQEVLCQSSGGETSDMAGRLQLKLVEASLQRPLESGKWHYFIYTNLWESLHIWGPIARSINNRCKIAAFASGWNLSGGGVGSVCLT